MKRAAVIILSLSAAVLGGLFWLVYGRQTSGDPTGSYAWLPAFNASMNTLCTACIVAGILAIRQGNKRLHGLCMASATTASAGFLVGYIIHHTLHGDSRYLGTGGWRTAYFTILISHIALSIVVVPLILGTLYLALTRNWPLHRRLARWTYPVWLYVSVTGVLIFVFLKS